MVGEDCAEEVETLLQPVLVVVLLQDLVECFRKYMIVYEIRPNL